MRAQCSVTSAALKGVEAIPVTVEVEVANGLPGIWIVGMADTAVQEARVRVRSAINAAGFVMPNEKIVVNLAPGSMKKNGSGFDLPIAMGLLVATGQVNPDVIERKLFVGELALKGAVRPVNGALAFAICAHKMGYGIVSGAEQSAPIDNLEQLLLPSLGRLHLEEPFSLPRLASIAGGENAQHEAKDMKDIAGHEVAKRALQIAAAGKHGLLMMGPPGSGKTMLASRIPSILPSLTQEEILETAAIHSVAGHDIEAILTGTRPFRDPHHSATIAGLLGGGTPVVPGEASLAHHGVLFLDELAEFKSSAIQALRQPIECGEVVITRAEQSIRLPAQFMLVAASNPCPCGYFGDERDQCSCTYAQIKRYQGRIGGPLLDRLSIQLDVGRLPASSVLESGTGTNSATLREGVLKARAFALWRSGRQIQGADSGIPHDLSDPSVAPSSIIALCHMTEEAQLFITSMAEVHDLSGRGFIGTLKVARTIADIAESEMVGAEHVAEALGFRIRQGSRV